MVIFNDIEDERDGGEAPTSVALELAAATAAVSATAPPELPVDALQRLPKVSADGGDPYWRLATAFLVGYPPHSSRAYFGDLKAWYACCAAAGVHPLHARRHHVDVWVRHLSETPQPATGRPASPMPVPGGSRFPIGF